MQENRPDVSKEAALTCSMWSATMWEPAVSIDVTEGMCMRQGFLAIWVYQVCLQAGASSFSSSRPETITYPWAKSPYKVWFLPASVVLLEQVLLRVSCKHPLQVMTTGVLPWALSLLCWLFLCLSQFTDGDISEHSPSCPPCFSRAMCRSTEHQALMGNRWRYSKWSTQKDLRNDTFGACHQPVGDIINEECLVGISRIESSYSKMVPMEGQ